MVIIFTSFCPIPNDKEKVLIGDNSGKIFIGKIKNIADIDLAGNNYQSILESIEEIYSFGKIGESYDRNFKPRDKYPIIRNLIYLSETEIIGHSDYGDIFLFNFRNAVVDIEILREGNFNRKNRMHRIASVNPNSFITSGNYGNFWIYSRSVDGTWDLIEKIFHDNAHFALDVFNENSYITNNYYGKTCIIDDSCNEIMELFGFNSNLQSIAILNDLIAAVDYSGNSFLYSKSSSDESRYINLQTIDCDEARVYPRVIYHKNHFFAVFPNKLWRFDPELDKIQNLDLKCKDVNLINETISILTNNDLVVVNPDSFVIPENYINYSFLKAGIVGYTDTGKSTFCYKMIYGDYKHDLGTTSGTLTWCLEFDDGDKIFIKDIPGQHDEIEFYFPKLKDCDIIFAMCKIKDSIKPWRDTIDMCENLRKKYNIEHFIFLRSQSDEKEKAPRSAIEQLLEKKGFDKNLLLDVSAKKDDGIEKFLDLLGKQIYWKKKRISTENRIKTKLISAIGEARASKTDKVNLKHFTLPGFKDLNLNILEKFIQKVADEDNIYYIPSTKDIIFNTEKMGLVQSYILENLFSVSDGLINESLIISDLEKSFIDIDSDELKFYYEDFINYLRDEEEIIEILPETFLIKKHLENKLDIPEDLLGTEIKIKKSIQVLDIIAIFENSLVILEEVAKNAFKFVDYDNGIIYIVLPELVNLDINAECNQIRIYIKNSDVIEKLFEALYNKLRGHELIDLPKILDFEKKYDDEFENLYYLFNYPDETPVIDFKREIIFEKKKRTVLKKIHKEILKDIIALSNSSYLYNNSAYLVIGLEENNGVFKKIQDVPNQTVLLQQIVFLCRRYINPVFNISPINIKINKIFELSNTRKIFKDIPFTPTQKTTACQEKIMILHITRTPKECLELNESISWESKKGIKKIRKGTSWIRIGSHTFEISNEERKKLFLV